MSSEKLSNFWYYHKWKVLLIGFFIFVLIYFGLTSLNSKASVLNINAYTSYFDLEKVAAEKEKLEGVITTNPKETVVFTVYDANKYAGAVDTQKIIGLIAEHKLDVLLAEKSWFSASVSSGSFKDLQTVPEIKDLANIGKIKLLKVENSEGVAAGDELLGIDMSTSNIIKDAGVETTDLILVVPLNSPHMEQVIKFIKYAFDIK